MPHVVGAVKLTGATVAAMLLGMATTIHLKDATEARVQAVRTAFIKEHRVHVSMSGLVDTLVGEALDARAKDEATRKEAKR